MKKFDKIYPYVRYANCFEDADVLAAIVDKNAQNILSISSGGDNSLSLLDDSIARLVVFDVNPAQLYLAKLKAAAFRHLDYDQMLVLIGLKEGDSLSQYAKLVPYLDSDVRDFFDHYLDFVTLKPLNCGKFEYYIRLINTKVLPLAVSKKKLDKFMSMNDPSEQALYFEKKINNLRWKLLTKKLFSAKTLSKFGRERSYFRYAEGDLASEIKKRFSAMIKRAKNCENPYLQYAVYNNFIHYPAYLREENFDRIKRNIDKLTFVEGDVFDILSLDIKFDFLNLSDIFEYMDQALTAQNESAIASLCNTGARVVFWNMMVERAFASSQFKQLDSQPYLRLEKTFYYSDLKIYSKE